MKRNTWIYLLGVLLLLLSGCVNSVMPAVDASPGPVDGDEPPPTVAPATQGRTVAADGELMSSYPTLALGFGGTVSGEVLTIIVTPGDILQAGDLIAQLDETELQRAVADAERTLARARTDRDLAQEQWERDIANAEQALAEAQRAQTSARLQYTSTSVEEALTALDRARDTEARAQDEYKRALDRPWEPQDIRDSYYNSWQQTIRDRELTEMRYNDARSANSANYLQLDARQADVDKAERSLAALQSGVAASYNRAVEDAEQQRVKAGEALARAQLVAPWAAMVLSVDVAPRSNVSASTPVVTLLSLEDGLRFVSQNLSEQHIAQLHPGQRAVVTLRTFPDTPLEGVVESVVSQTRTTTDGTARFTVRVRLETNDLALLPGLTGRAEIFTASDDNP